MLLAIVNWVGWPTKICAVFVWAPPLTAHLLSCFHCLSVQTQADRRSNSCLQPPPAEFLSQPSTGTQPTIFQIQLFLSGKEALLLINHLRSQSDLKDSFRFSSVRFLSKSRTDEILQQSFVRLILMNFKVCF